MLCRFLLLFILGVNLLWFFPIFKFGIFIGICLKVILEDLELLNVKYDIFSHTSDHFDRMSDMMEKMIQEGKAFVDMTSAEELKEQRLACKPSPYRDQSVDENLRLWEEMKKGSEIGVKCFVRAKIDYKNTNGALRDPTLYRCKNEPHIR